MKHQPQRSRLGLSWVVGSFLVTSHSLWKHFSKSYKCRLICQRNFQSSRVWKYCQRPPRLLRYFELKESPSTSRSYWTSHYAHWKMQHNSSLQPQTWVENSHRFPRHIEFRSDKLSNFGGELLVLGLEESQKQQEEVHPIPSTLVDQLDKQQQEAIYSLLKETRFQGKLGSSQYQRIFLPGVGIRYIALFGLGKIENSNTTTTIDIRRKLGAFIGQIALQYKTCTSAGIWTSFSSWTQDQIQALLEEIMLSSYKDDRFKGTPDETDSPCIKEVCLLDETKVQSSTVTKAKNMVSGIIMTKELVFAPANSVTPTLLSQVAIHLAQQYGMEYKILDKEQCQKMNMGCYLGVAQGSSEPPKFIHLKYSPVQGPVKKKIALIGKAITFDSGGYNLKAGVGSMIELMKFDMGGCAAVLGAAKVIGELKPNHIQVHFIAASCENMISGNAYHPGDVLQASNGKTVEVINTDAEGRLTLADALVYAEQIDTFDCIIDVATLTGAIIIALGNEYAGFWANQEELAKRIESASQRCGEKLWRMPLVNEYMESLKSKIADLKNVGGRAGGSIAAALFLREFVKHAPWAHIDIAGTVWNEKQSVATGFGVRTLVELCESYSQE
ncbi:Probable cytosol aminopeptidase [Galdieria sulphuraria]|uniref:Leucyl aminopeptidase n=1 Tax=Galdieria sulphuraria TaxID=130081 RepID=M2VX19_GALSU|nr:leucyl aminopeptidase [Galdieria sulphuraria]EME27796.1 leucyl aminopeptidase [Galdieria sulphuraria]GJD05787.1 Probable cytosol aminopeptidase [Galdieria sulphuraria]|eukprot:XP_005704316.1 leucyl aminopeptidase [Galdieria sulphuraria]